MLLGVEGYNGAERYYHSVILSHHTKSSYVKVSMTPFRFSLSLFPLLYFLLPSQQHDPSRMRSLVPARVRSRVNTHHI
jgi:hypothetical protein